MKKNIFLHIQNESGSCSALCNSWEEVHALTFSPSLLDCFIFDFKIKGKTYQERQQYARSMAQRFQSVQPSALSWSECADIAAAWHRIARRFGLIQEFKENAII